MYLEISGRRSGKTTRLIDDLVEYIEVYDKPVYISSLVQYSAIRDRIPPRLRCMVYPLPAENKEIDWFRRQYYDELDLLGRWFIVDNAYYSGTPNSTHYLKELIELNGFTFEHYAFNRGKSTEKELGELKAQLSPQEYRREILGKY